MLTEEHKKLIGDAEVLTRDGGLVPVSHSQRKQVAIFSNGLVFSASGYRYQPEFKALKRRIESLGQPVLTFHEVDVSTLDEVYRSTAGGVVPTENFPVELERLKKLREIIRKAASDKASDIVIRVLPGYTEIRTRVFGRMKDLETDKADEGLMMIMAAFASAEDLGGTTSIYTFMQGKLGLKSNLLPPFVEMIRLQYSPTSDGRGALVMRLKYESPANEIEINHLGYNPQQIEDITTMRKRTNGLYILAGKVSSGKSTTLQRVLNKMNIDKQREISMYTIEEPVELDLPGAIQVPAKKNPDGTDGFAMAMKASLRSDPNIIVLGEIRSAELAALGIQAVMTGHALWSTVHAGTALGILDRLIDLGVEQWKLADPTVVRGLVYQRLSGVLCKKCRVTFPEAVRNGSLEKPLAIKVAKLFGRNPNELYSRGAGCSNCKMGLAGRTVVAETVLTDPKLLEMFVRSDRAGMRKYWLSPTAEGGLGGVPVLHHALSKVGAGICDINEVEEEVDLFDVYTKEFMFLRPKLLADTEALLELERKKEK